MRLVPITEEDARLFRLLRVNDPDISAAHSRVVTAYEEGITEEEGWLLMEHLRLTREQIGRNPESWAPWAKLRAAFKEEK